MIEYALHDAAGLVLRLNGPSATGVLKKSLTLGDASNKFKQGLISKSYGPGSLLLGEPKVLTNSINLSMQAVFETDAAYRLYMNTLISSLLKATYLVDVTNNLRTQIACTGVSEKVDKGSTARSIELTANLTLVDGWWEDLVEQSVTINLPTATYTNIGLNNQGFLPTVFNARMTVAGLCAYAGFDLPASLVALTINDASFGQPNYTTLLVDGNKGLCTIGNKFVNNSISPGSGFFMLPPGNNLLRAVSAIQSELVVTFRQRYFR